MSNLSHLSNALRPSLTSLSNLSSRSILVSCVPNQSSLCNRSSLSPLPDLSFPHLLDGIHLKICSYLPIHVSCPSVSQLTFSSLLSSDPFMCPIFLISPMNLVYLLYVIYLPDRIHLFMYLSTFPGRIVFLPYPMLSYLF